MASIIDFGSSIIGLALQRQCILVLKQWLVLLPLIITCGNSQYHYQHTGDDINAGFISIDCGVAESYIDPNTSISYQPDTGFIETGKNYGLPSDQNIDNPYFGEQLKTLRSFEKENKHCYTLKPKQGKNNSYLIRAFFAYGNYDNKDQPPTFNLYIDAYLWETIKPSAEPYYYTEVNYTPPTDTIYVCLLNIGQGTPYISSLELRPLDSLYQATPIPLPLYLKGRFDIGTLTRFRHSRFKEDIYDRIWNNQNQDEWIRFNKSADIDIEGYEYKLPAQVLTTAIRPSNDSYAIDFRAGSNSYWEYYVYLHFVEIEQLEPGKKRIINVTIDDKTVLSKPITLEYLKPHVVSSQVASIGYAKFSVSATEESDLPPILNAMEIYGRLPQNNSPTDTGDVHTILEIKHQYGISRDNWQGDPCLPLTHTWVGLSCSTDNSPRIISVDLSSSTLTGEISTSFLNLTRLESLDLSNNDLTGPLPESLAELQHLKFLNLSWNKLTGPIPRGLMEKSYNKTLQLSLDGNPGLCLSSSCKKHKPVVPVAAIIAVLSIIVFSSLLVLAWIFIRKRQISRKRQEVMIVTSKKEGTLRLQNRVFSHLEILSFTNNLTTIIGEGGFGKVYLGSLQDGTQVAVKMLTRESKQGFKAFQSEAELLLVLHHRNLVSLIGYCDEGDVKALVYEYMANGNLQQKLSVKNPNVLKWKERLQIAVGAANGLDYLHNGCKPPIIHRDLKTSNILLDDNMEAKIADFGLSRAFVNDIESHISTLPAGTPGYLDPQFLASKKSDIYSFGIILFELITGQQAVIQTSGNVVHILNWVVPVIEEGDLQKIMDPRLQGNFSTTSAHKAIEAAMSCIPTAAYQRADISHILAELKECLALEMTHERSSLPRESPITEILAR